MILTSVQKAKNFFKLNKIPMQIKFQCLFSLLSWKLTHRERGWKKIVKIIYTRKSVNLCITECRRKICYEFSVQRQNQCYFFWNRRQHNEWKSHKEIVQTHVYASNVATCAFFRSLSLYFGQKERSATSLVFAQITKQNWKKRRKRIFKLNKKKVM